MGKSSETGKSGADRQVALAGTIDGGIHRLEARVYFADTDFSGAVYHARYLEFLERGRSDYLRVVGVHHTDLLEGSEGEVLFWVVRRMEIDFQRSARIDDIITVETRIEDVSGARIQMAQKLLRDGETLVEARVTAALINDAGKPRRFPKAWAKLFST